jgi:hypothetical protein
MATTKKFDPKTILDHPDKDEIIAKLAIGTSPSDISEWLACKYESIDEKKFCLSEKVLKTFYEQYYDFYTIVREDAQKVSSASPNQQVETALAGNITYQKALERYTNKEVNVREIIAKLVASIETRAEQLFDLIQEDSRNTKMDKGFVDMMNLLLSTCEKFEPIINGTTGSQVNIQNNFSIQVVDKHIAMVSNLITRILSEIDLDASMRFMDMYNEEMSKLKSDDSAPLPIEVRLNEAKSLEFTTNHKLSQ